MIDSIKRRSLAVLLTLAMIIGMMPSVALTAYGDATTSISLVAAPNFVFDPATEGYGTQPPYSVRVQNTGTADTGALDITLSGNNPDKFALSMTSISDITVGNEQSFQVAYKAGLPAGIYTATVTVSGTHVESKSFDIGPATVTAHDSTELQNYMAAPYVSTINLVSGTEYTYDGGVINRLLTINGNGATINVGTGISDTIVKRVDPISGAVNSASGKTFLAIEGTNSSLIMKNVKLHDEATRLLAAINVKTGGTLLLDGVTLDGFFANKEDDTYPNASNIPGSFNNFGVHAEPGAISTTVKNCVFGSSNSFRNAVAIRNGIALITSNTFVGTANPNRQNQTDGFEYAIYLYGGTCTVTGNNISGYDSILKTNLGYHSAGITTCPFYDLTATITGNTLHDNARGIDGVGSWHTYSHPAVANINGTELTTSANVFTIGQGLKGANAFSNNTDGNIALAFDQNDNYTDSSTGIEYGPPAYSDTFLKAGSTTQNSATLSFDTSAWAKSIIRNAKSFKIEVSEDNGATWKVASTTETLNSSSGSVTVNLASGKTYLLRAALTITAKTMPYGSDTDVYTDADILCYSNTVSQVITPSSNPNSGHSGSSSSGSSSSTTTNSVVEVNGQKQDAGLASTDKNGGKTVTTVKVDDTKLEKILESKGSNATVTLPINAASDIVVGELNGQTVKNMEKKEATLEIKTEKVTYTLPASQINIDSVSKQIGTQVALKDIKVSITIAEPASETVKVVENIANKNSYQIIVKPVEFAISCTSGGKTVDVSKFNGYVERIVAIPDGIDPSKITTGIVLNEDGTFRHVPTQVTAINGKYYAKINSLTNSTYSVIYNPMEFADVSNHWAKKEINNMGSRMVVTGVGNNEYDPDRSITRGEFAAILVRALGLAQGTSGSGFQDVEGSKWYSGYIKTASEYGIIKGYSAVQFGPNDKITREQAMTMIARAMKITGLNVEPSKNEVSTSLENYADAATTSNYAKASIEACLKTGIITGRSSNSIAPKEYITRAEIAVIVQRLLQKSNLINQ